MEFVSNEALTPSWLVAQAPLRRLSGAVAAKLIFGGSFSNSRRPRRIDPRRDQMAHDQRAVVR
jgi:hypothetical protein